MLDVIIISAVVGFIVGWLIKGAIVIHKMAANPDEVIAILEKIKEFDQTVKTPGGTRGIVQEIVVNKVGDMLYAFNEQDSKYVSQGITLEELMENAKLRFPNVTFKVKVDSTEKVA